MKLEEINIEDIQTYLDFILDKISYLRESYQDLNLFLSKSL